MRHIIYNNHGTIQSTTVSTEELFETLQSLNAQGCTIVKVESLDDTVIPLPVHESLKAIGGDYSPAAQADSLPGPLNSDLTAEPRDEVYLLASLNGIPQLFSMGNGDSCGFYADRDRPETGSIPVVDKLTKSPIIKKQTNEKEKNKND